MDSWLELALGLVSLGNVALTWYVKRNTSSTHGIATGNANVINELFGMNRAQLDALNVLLQPRTTKEEDTLVDIKKPSGL